MNWPAQAAASRGKQAEDLACAYLQRAGLQLIERNYRTARGEIDLVMQDGRSMVFVEVRYRRSSRFGGAASSVDYRKQARLIAAAAHYLQQHPLAAQLPSRFDVVAIAGDAQQDDREQWQWIKNAFQSG